MTIVKDTNKTYSVNMRDEEYTFNIINQIITLTSFLQEQRREGRSIGSSVNQMTHMADLTDRLIDFVSESKMPSTHQVDSDFDDAYGDRLTITLD